MSGSGDDDEVLARVLQQSLEEVQESAMRQPDAAYMSTMYGRHGLAHAARGEAPGQRRYVDHLNMPTERQQTVQYRRVSLLDMARKERPGHWLQESTCPISQQEFTEGCVVAITSCGHFMLRSGLEQWVQTRSTCPMCRAPLFNPWISPSVEVWTHGDVDETVAAAAEQHGVAELLRGSSAGKRTDIHIQTSKKARKRSRGSRGSRWAVPESHPLLEGVPAGHRVLPSPEEYAYVLPRPSAIVD